MSFKSRLGWISAVEKNNQIISVSFGKSKTKGSSTELKKLQKKLKMSLIVITHDLTIIKNITDLSHTVLCLAGVMGCWDSEYHTHAVSVPPGRIDSAWPE